MTQLRLVSYNVRGLRDDAAAVASVLRDLDPDVVCVQEAPRRLAWRGRCAALARQSHLLYAGGGGTSGGTALFTAVRVDIRDVQEHRLRHTPGLNRRGVVLASLAKGPARFGVASVHLGLDPAERARHLTDITGLMHRLTRAGSTAGSMVGAPVPLALIAGDLNENESAPTWARLAAQYRDLGAHEPTPTFSTARPRHRIDGVFMRGAARLVSYQVIDSPAVAAASDHRPVVVDLVVDSA